jgi:hypothetical protein
LLINPGVLHTTSLAKYAVAFFRISHSRFSLTFSARSRDKSICSCVTGLVPAPVSLPAADNSTQLRSVCSTRPSSLADKTKRLPLLYMLNRPFLELTRVFLLRDLLHLLPPKINVNCTSPLEDYLSGEPQLPTDDIKADNSCASEPDKSKNSRQAQLKPLS